MKKRWMYGFGIVAVIIAAAFVVWTTLQKEQVPTKVDVVVIGGEPEGVAAAISAARNGAKVVLVEHRDELGGLFTYGMLNFLDIPQGGPDQTSLSRGIFEEWHQKVGGQSAFDVELAKQVFREMVEAEENITLLTETNVELVETTNSAVTAVEVKNANGTYRIKAQSFIDATQDADFAVLAGAPYFVGGEDIGIEDKKMSVTLMMHLTNVDWEGVKKTAESGKFGESYATETAGWGFGEMLRMYKPQEENTRLRGLNIARVGEDIYINALQIFGVDGLDPDSKAEAIERGKREIDHIVEYLRKEFGGFEQAVVKSYPPELYVRETRHIKAEYQLPMADVWTNRYHWDSIAYGAYPVDIQAQTIHDFGAVVSTPQGYSIPFRSIVPQKIDGLLVVGRASVFSSLAAGSARVVPTGMAVAEAAGAAAAQIKGTGQTFRHLSQDEGGIEKLQTTLENQGAIVRDVPTTYPYAGEWFDESVQALINYGVIFGRYNNDLLVDNETSEQAFGELIKEILYRANRSVYNQYEDSIEQTVAKLRKDAVTPDTVLPILSEMFGGNDLSTLHSNSKFHEAWKQIEQNGAVQFKHVMVIAHAMMTYKP